MHVPISHATLQCSATPSASMHPRPNPSFLSMAASRRCLGALSKGMGGGSQKKKKGVKEGAKKKDRVTRRLNVAPKPQYVVPRRGGWRGGGYVGETRQDAVRGKVWCMARLQEATPMLFLRRLSAAWSCILRLAWKRELKQRFCFFIFSTPHPSSHPVPVICFFSPMS